MRILMLGWEFPPFIAGGLGTACQGMTKALVAHGHDVLFVLPQPVPPDHRSHVELMGPETLRRMYRQVRTFAQTYPEAPPPAPESAATSRLGPGPTRAGDAGPAEAGELTRIEVPAKVPSPYPGAGSHATVGELIDRIRGADAEGASEEHPLTRLRGSTAKELTEALGAVIEHVGSLGAGGGYGSDLFGDAERYANLVAALASRLSFDVIHAHDWLAFPAGLTAKAITGKPLVCHVHATEFDRSGEHINQRVYDMERAGIHGADRVIAVSRLTKSICSRRYGADERKVDVVYNGVEQSGVLPHKGDRIEQHDKIVLFLGRITMQKGPEYFIRAAKRVLEKMDNVKFVVAGSGDMAVRMIEDAAALGIGHKVLFTGFLRGRDVDRVFAMADCYVMPSVSEPFGIAPLEAMRNDTPVIISKQSGVSEVLTHALKVDFWDIDDMASKIIAVLRYPPLSQTLRQHGAFELRGITWDGAAEKYVKVYNRAIKGVAR